MIRISSAELHYAWGSPTAIPALLGTEPTGAPVAEAWFGAHPAGASPVLADGADEPAPGTLTDVIARDPQQALGSDVVARFGPGLPYLLKVIAPDRPLSLQVHPHVAAARAGFERE
jgi:mannose-6-phosphate isomerase